MSKHICPSCGNRDAKLIEDNGLPRRSPDYTLLCVKTIPAKESSFDIETLARLGHVINGYVKCGTQWEPNESVA